MSFCQLGSRVRGNDENSDVRFPASERQTGPSKTGTGHAGRRLAASHLPAETEMNMAQKGGGGNPGAVTKKGGDGATGSTGTGRGGGKTGNSGKKG